MNYRPRLDVESPYLLYVYGVSRSIDWIGMKRNLKRSCQVRFIETFEGWTHTKMDRAIVQFDTIQGLESFMKFTRSRDFPSKYVKTHKLRNKREFFDLILQDTGIDLLECKAVPPSVLRARSNSREIYVRDVIITNQEKANSSSADSMSMSMSISSSSQQEFELPETEATDDNIQSKMENVQSENNLVPALVVKNLPTMFDDLKELKKVLGISELDIPSRCIRDCMIDSATVSFFFRNQEDYNKVSLFVEEQELQIAFGNENRKITIVWTKDKLPI